MGTRILVLGCDRVHLEGGLFQPYVEFHHLHHGILGYGCDDGRIGIDIPCVVVTYESNHDR
jgi:hypothetical protein